MHFTLALLPLLASVASSETVFGATLFSRHGDRTWKGTPPTRLTNVGQNQLYSSGAYWRSRYLSRNSPHHISGISEDTYNAAQISAATPDQPILKTSGQAFLQGLYPPVAVTETLANGSTVQAPLSGFQYVPLTTVPEDSSETIWLKGDDGCPAYTTAVKSWTTTDEAKALTSSTKDFYESFYDEIFSGVLAKDQLDYTNAYNIYDYINVGMVHNSTISNAVSDAQLHQLETLASSAEWAQNGAINTASDPLAVSGRTLSARFLQQLQAIVDNKAAKKKLNINIGSYDTFMAFFGLTGLPAVNKDFYGLPEYASVIALELFTEKDEATFPSNENDLKVRFLFRNGTDAEAKEFRLFGDESAMSWSTFKTGIEKVALTSVEEWCTFCGSEEAYCKYAEVKEDASAASLSRRSGLSVTESGVLGAMVTLGVCLLIAAAAFLGGLRVTKRSKLVGVTTVHVSGEKGTSINSDYS